MCIGALVNDYSFLSSPRDVWKQIDGVMGLAGTHHRLSSSRWATPRDHMQVNGFRYRSARMGTEKGRKHRTLAVSSVAKTISPLTPNEWPMYFIEVPSLLWFFPPCHCFSFFRAVPAILSTSDTMWSIEQRCNFSVHYTIRWRMKCSIIQAIWIVWTQQMDVSADARPD